MQRNLSYTPFPNNTREKIMRNDCVWSPPWLARVVPPFTSVTGCVLLGIKPRALLGTVEGEQLQSGITVSDLNQSRLPWLAIWQWQHTPLMSQTNALVMLLGGVDTSPPPPLSLSHPNIKIARPVNLIGITTYAQV